MKKLPLIILLFAAACSSKNNSSGGASDPNAITVSTKGIGDLKVGMKKETVEKLLKHKIMLPHLSADSPGFYIDTVTCKYKDIDYTLLFSKEWQESDSSTFVKVSQVGSHSPLLKTPSGIGIGDDVCKIAGTYADDRISIMPVYDYKGKEPVRIKGKSEVWLSLPDEASEKVIIFYMNNNKVESMAVTFYMGD